MIIHQSDIKSWHRCGEQHRRQLRGDQGKQLSRTAYGSVMHHALHTLERERDLQLAIDTFTWYWHPLRIDAICRPVDVWIGRDSHGGLLAKGVETLKRYWDLKRYDDEEVLALEIPFTVPIHGTYDADTGEPHYLAGTIDRLALRRYSGRLNLCVDDWKSGKKQPYLKHNLQGTGYCYATLCEEFWTGSERFLTDGFGLERGKELFTRLARVPRKFYWINVANYTPDWSSGGARTERDYARFRHAVQQYCEARTHGVYPLNIDGEICQWCPFNDDCPEGLDERLAQQHEALRTGAVL